MEVINLIHSFSIVVIEYGNMDSRTYVCSTSDKSGFKTFGIEDITERDLYEEWVGQHNNKEYRFIRVK